MLYETGIINGCLVFRYLHRAMWSYTAFLLLMEDVERFDSRYTVNGRSYAGTRYNLISGKPFPHDPEQDDWWGTTLPAERLKEFLEFIRTSV